MKKLPSYYENPIDNIIYKFIAPTSHQLDCLTPNFITLLSFISGLLSMYYYKNNNVEYSTILFFISYFFDVLDGFHARRKNICSTFGSYFDHISDLVISFIFLFITYQKYKDYKYFYHICGTTLISVIIMYLHLSLRELYHEKDNSIFLNVFNLKNKESIKYLSFTRYFGTGTFMLLYCIIIFYSKYL